ncbi:MAG TPA: patatin-like phospholipase family protein, partial [Calditrichia bacterium]|nr:patatin-like phospholipase family protein [Calditrichia bacterium]
VILQEGDIATAIMASTALPGIFAPVSVGERMLVDGGLTENIPISALHRLGATFTLGVDLIYKRDYGKPRNIIDVLTNAIDIAINNGNLNYLRKADALIMPNLSGYDMVKNKDVEALVREGYTCAHLELQKIRQLDLI